MVFKKSTISASEQLIKTTAAKGKEGELQKRTTCQSPLLRYKIKVLLRK